MEQPQSYPIIFKELQVSSYQQLIEVLNFNFSRIANSPLFRGKIGHTGDAGSPGISGIRGNRLMYVNINTWNTIFEDSKTIKDFADTELTGQLLNACMDINDESGKYEKLKQVLGLHNKFTPDDVNILLEFDWIVMPNGGCWVLQNNYNANGDIESQYWLYSGLTLVTSDDATLQQTIEDLIAQALGTMTIGAMKLYKITFHVAQDVDDPEITAGNNGSPEVGALDVVVDNDECKTNATSAISSTQLINAMTDDTKRNEGKWPITMFGSINDWYRTMQNTLPTTETDNVRNLYFTPSQSTAPSGVFFQDNDHSGILLGKRPTPIYDDNDKIIGFNLNNFHDFANIVKTKDGLLFMPKFSRWQNESTKYFDEYMSKMYLSTHVFEGQLIDESALSSQSTSKYRYTKDAATIKKLQSYVIANDILFAGYQEVPNQLGDVSQNMAAALINYLQLFRFYEYTDDAGKTVIKPAIIVSDESELVMPERMANGLLMTKNKRVQLAGFDGDKVADIRHVHRLPGTVAYEPLSNSAVQLLSNIDSSVTVYTVIVLPSMRMKLQEQLNIHVLVESLSYCLGSAGLKSAELLQQSSYAIMKESNDLASLTYEVLDTTRFESESIITQSIAELSSFTDYESFAKKAVRSLHSYIIKGFEPLYEASTGSTLPARLVIKQVFTLKGKANATAIAIGSPKVTALPMLTDIGIDRHDIDPVVVYLLRINAQSGFNAANIDMTVNEVKTVVPAVVQVDSKNNVIKLHAVYETAPGSGKSHYDAIDKTITVIEENQDEILVFNRRTYTLTIKTVPDTATVMLNGSTKVDKSIRVPSESTVTWKVQVDRGSNVLYTPQSGSIQVTEPVQEHTVSLKPFVKYILNTVPTGATIKFTVTGTDYDDWARITGNTAYVPVGSNIAWSASKDGYGTKTGNVTNLQSDKTDIIELTPYVTLTITTVPANATVKINNVVRKSIRDLAGTKVTILVQATGYSDYTQTYTLPNKDHTLNIDMTNQQLKYSVEVKPTPSDATVTLNGKTYPNNIINDVVHGSYVDWVVSKQHYESKSGRKENITQNFIDSNAIKVNLDYTPYFITFNLTPSSARVYIDGGSEAHSSGYRLQSHYGARHSYRVSASGYDTVSNNITVTGNETVNVNLNRTAATVKVQLSPTNSTLSIGSKTYKHNDTISGYFVGDSFSWSCSANGFDTKTGTYNISSATNTLSVSLSGTERSVTFNLFPTNATINVAGIGSFSNGQIAKLIENETYTWSCSANNYYTATEVQHGASGSNTGLIRVGSSDFTWKVVLIQNYCTITVKTKPETGVVVSANGTTYKHNDKFTYSKNKSFTWTATCPGYDPISIPQTYSVGSNDTAEFVVDMSTGLQARTVNIDTRTNNGSLDVAVTINGQTYKHGASIRTTKGTVLSWTAAATDYYNKTGSYTVSDTTATQTIVIPKLEPAVTDYTFNIVDENKSPIVANLVVNGQTYTGKSTYSVSLTIGSTAKARAYVATSGTTPDTTWKPSPLSGTQDVKVTVGGSTTFTMSRIMSSLTLTAISHDTGEQMSDAYIFYGSTGPHKGGRVTVTDVINSTITGIKAFKALPSGEPDPNYHPYPKTGGTESIKLTATVMSKNLEIQRKTTNVTFVIISSLTQSGVAATLVVNDKQYTGQTTYKLSFPAGSNITYSASNGDNWGKFPEAGGAQTYTVPAEDATVNIVLTPKGGIGYWIIDGSDENFAFKVQ